jgi:hypothetical protein
LIVGLLISQQASAGGVGVVSGGRGFGGPGGGPPGEQVQVKVPNNKVTLIIDSVELRVLNVFLRCIT